MQEMHGHDIDQELAYQPKGVQANLTKGLPQRHQELHENEEWNEAAEPHTHSRRADFETGRLD